MVLIFLTGAIVLSLEVLSSRIMTPYFGVSLFIWAGILSITLTFLAVGYYFGGRISKRTDRAGQAAVFYFMPVLAAVAVFGACLIYPFVFPLLSRADLILGSFAAAAVLLAVPLVCLSAMNPLLISLRASPERKDDSGGDGGAGLVLFISTAGSVAGVLVTAFMLIPGFTNFEALLWLGLALCGFTVAAAVRGAHLDPARRRHLFMAAAVAGALCAALIFAQDRYLRLLSAVDPVDVSVSILAEYTSVFGNIKVAHVTPDGPGNVPMKVYVQDGLIQNLATPENISVSMYTYVLDRLAAGFAPQAKSAVVLGLGAGFVPRFLRDRGLAVSVVEINPQSVRAAAEHFGFPAANFDVAVTDARTYVRACRQAFDVAVVDLFQGDATPDYLMTAEFFADLRRCLKPGGAVVMNAFFDDDDETPNKRLLATIQSAFGSVIRFQPGEENAFVVGLTVTPKADVDYDMNGIPDALKGRAFKTLQAGRLVRSGELLGYPVVTDRRNDFSTLMANARMTHRQWLTGNVPARLLVN